MQYSQFIYSGYCLNNVFFFTYHYTSVDAVNYFTCPQYQ